VLISPYAPIQVNNAVHYSGGLRAWVTGPGAQDLRVTVGDTESNRVLVHYDGDRAASTAQEACVHIAKK